MFSRIYFSERNGKFDRFSRVEFHKKKIFSKNASNLEDSKIARDSLRVVERGTRKDEKNSRAFVFFMVQVRGGLESGVVVSR